MISRKAIKLALLSTVMIPWIESMADQEVQLPAPVAAPAPAVPGPPLAPKPTRLTQEQTLTHPPAAAITDRASADRTSAAPGPKFVANDKWLIAGYNNDEIIYQVFITSQDTRIIRCITEIHGFYFDSGKKQSISDRQITTVFPNQPTQAGTWLDMDQQSGATYSVKCHPL